MNIDMALYELWIAEQIDTKQFLALQRALRNSQEAELIMSRVESINNNGEQHD